MVEVEKADNPKKILFDALQSPIGFDYMEEYEANAVIIAAAYIDRQINGTKFSSPDQGVSLKVDTFPDRHPTQDFMDLKESAIIALHQVLSENSELNELWAENEEDYSIWRKGVEELIQRLKNY